MSRTMAQALPGISAEPCFDTLYADNHARLRRLARMLCADPELADDLLQETWLRAWRALDSLHDVAASKAWLITILKREHARLFERKRLDYVAFAEDNPELGRVSRPEQGIYLRQLLGRLSPAEREPLLLQVVDGVPVADIATQAGVSRNAMTIRLHRIRQRLREI
ncbi:MAG: sigma-70 family RNA polymerase sigma factor [Gammaproteobacteria bacterium]|nr:sigma-70 family RNA polymerase sigma factor [Gammaproteobacteria bacterium]